MTDHPAITRRTLLGGAVGAVGTAAVVGFTGVESAAAAPKIPGAPWIDIVDTRAAYNTKSLYQYLIEQRGKGVLWGHQHDINQGHTFEQPNWTDPSVEFPHSDVYAGTGEYPAVIGWDTLILEGMERPGSLINPNQNENRGPEYLAVHGKENAKIWAQGMLRAHELGAVNTISAHTYDFLSSGGGRTVSQILPGGDKNGEFNDFLDLIALTANLTQTTDGESIPIIFRPFHENNGSWFWWGAARATAGEYKEIFRYTVEYLRDVKGVDNFLYAYSPNGSLSGDPERYLETYPGDNFVDVMGYDLYEQSSSASSDAFIGTALTDLRMITDLAQEHGKIPAFTEFGDLRDPSATDLSFYSDLITAIKEDPTAKRITYMLTWISEQPYPAVAGVPEHPMYQDFMELYQDPYSVFSTGVVGAYDNKATAEPTETSLRVVSPADGVRLPEPTTTLRVATTGEAPKSVMFSAPGATDQVLKRDRRRPPARWSPRQRNALPAYFSGQWNIGEENLTNQSAIVTVTATYKDGSTSVAQSRVVLGAPPELPLGVVDDFEGYGDDAALHAAFTFSNAPATDFALTTHPVGGGEQALKFSYDFTSRDYCGIGKSFQQDWSDFNHMNLWIDPDASGQKLVLQLNTANGESFEAYPGLETDEPYELSVDFQDFLAKSDGGNPTVADLASVTSFWIFINKVGDFGASSIVVDNIRAGR